MYCIEGQGISAQNDAEMIRGLQNRKFASDKVSDTGSVYWYWYGESREDLSSKVDGMEKNFPLFFSLTDNSCNPYQHESRQAVRDAGLWFLDSKSDS